MTRKNAFPDYRIEQEPFLDIGCSASPSCLTCPLPRCRYDVIGGIRAIMNVRRNAEMRAAYLDGESVIEIAKRYSLTRRSVFRILQGAHR